MGPYGTYITASLESRLYFSVQKIIRLRFAVSFVVSSCDSKFSVLDLSAQRPKMNSIVKFQ